MTEKWLGLSTERDGAYAKLVVFASALRLGIERNWQLIYSGAKVITQHIMFTRVRRLFQRLIICPVGC